jgi:hypothetical protein
LFQGVLVDYSTLNFFGSDFVWKEVAVPGGELVGQLTGTLSDGSVLNAGLALGSDLRIAVIFTGNRQNEEVTFVPSLAVTPEPSSIVTFGLGILGLALVCKSKRVRRRLFPGSAR